MLFFIVMLVIFVMVAISRWVFRINDIVKNLEQINANTVRDKPVLK